MSQEAPPNGTDPRNAPAMLTYLNMLQSAISRMGMNSLYCKILCGTILAALGTVSDLKGCSFFLTALFPLFVCSWADARYLSLERVYRKKFNKTVDKHYRDCPHDDAPELFDMDPGKEYLNCENQKQSFRSWSIWCIYLVLLIYAIMIALLKL